MDVDIIVKHSKLLSWRIDPGDYIIYVFQDLDAEKIYEKYIMCTKFPNWETPPIKIGEKGYLRIKEIEAGRSTWYDVAKDCTQLYRYDMIQFIDFIKEQDMQSEIVV